ncbi:MAG TPA: site-specific integrase [Stellaceae bacterium]|nr:site-specific integrase [Stellaceae bacterium]
MSGRGTIRKRGNAFELRYQVGGKTATETFRGERRDAEKRLRALLKLVDEGASKAPTRETLSAWLTRWLADKKAKTAASTHQRYSEIAEKTIGPAIGDVPLGKLTPDRIAEFYTDLATKGRRDGKGGLSPRTQRHVHRLLRSALGTAARRELIMRNPADELGAELPKIIKPDLAALNASQAGKLLAAVEHSQIYPAVLLALGAGLRRGETLAASWGDLRGDVLTVRRSLGQTRTGIAFKTPKNGRPRHVVLPSDVADALRAWKVRQAQQLLQLGIRQSAETLICARMDGEPLQPQSLTHEFPRFLARLGADFPRVRFHDLRHSSATIALAAGVDLKLVSERLGHTTIAITADLYLHPDQTMHEAAAQKINDAFRLVAKSVANQG